MLEFLRIYCDLRVDIFFYKNVLLMKAYWENISFCKLLKIKNRFFSHTKQFNHSFPSLQFSKLSPTSSLSQIHSYSALQKRSGLQEKTAKQYKTRYNKKAASYWGCTRQPGRRKRISSAGKRVREIPDFLRKVEARELSISYCIKILFCYRDGSNGKNTSTS